MHKKELQIRLGKRISELRKQRKLSQVEFAYILDKEKQNYNKIEKGQTNPTIWTLFEIATILEVPLAELFNWDNSI